MLLSFQATTASVGLTPHIFVETLRSIHVWSTKSWQWMARVELPQGSWSWQRWSFALRSGCFGQGNKEQLPALLWMVLLIINVDDHPDDNDMVMPVMRVMKVMVVMIPGAFTLGRKA